MAEEDRCQWCDRLISNHMDAYYYGFEPTGVPEVDRILCAVAAAGKAYHHTEDWHGHSDTATDYVQMIQDAANAAAESTKPAHRIHLGEVEVSYQVLGYDWPCIYKVHSTGGHAELPFRPPKGLAEGKYRLLLEPLETGDDDA